MNKDNGIYVDGKILAQANVDLHSFTTNNWLESIKNINSCIPSRFTASDKIEIILEDAETISTKSVDVLNRLQNSISNYLMFDESFANDYFSALEEMKSNENITSEDIFTIDFLLRTKERVEIKEERDILLEKQKNGTLTEEEKEKLGILNAYIEADEFSASLFYETDRYNYEFVTKLAQSNEKWAIYWTKIDAQNDKSIEEVKNLIESTSDPVEKEKLQRQLQGLEMNGYQIDNNILEYKKLPDLTEYLSEKEIKAIPSDAEYWKYFGSSQVYSGSGQYGLGEIEWTHIDVKEYNKEIDKKKAKNSIEYNKIGEDYFKYLSTECQKQSENPYLTPEARAEYSYLADYYNWSSISCTNDKNYYEIEIKKLDCDPKSDDYEECTEQQLNLKIRLYTYKPDNLKTEEDQYMLSYYEWGRDNIGDYIDIESNKTNKNFFEGNSIINISDYEYIKDKNDFNNMSGLEKFWQNSVTFGSSVVIGVVDVGETIVDGAVQIVGGGASYVVSWIDEESGQSMKDGVQDFVSYDASGKLYDGFVEWADINDEIAYGWAHTAGNMIGSVAGYAAITYFTGGTATILLSGAAAAGSTAEAAYANGASFDEAMIASSINFTVGAAAGAGMDKLGAVAKGATSLKGVAGFAGGGAVIGAAEPFANTVVEYFTYGNDNGQSYLDYMNESGGWTKVGMGAAAGGLSIGAQAYGGYKTHGYKSQFNDNMDSLADTERAQGWGDFSDPRRTSTWEDYYRQQYGDSFEGRFSGHGYMEDATSYVDPNATDINRQLLLTKAKEISGWIDITEPRALIWTVSDTGKINVDVDWPKYGGMKLNTVKGIEEIEGDILLLDRFGSQGGGTYALIPKSGKPYTLKERSIFNNLNSSNPNVSGYRQIEFNKTKYMDFCDGADSIISYCNKNAIDYSTASLDPYVQSQIETLTTKLGLELNSDNIAKVDSAIFGERGSYISDLALKDGSYYKGNGTKSGAWRDDIVGVEEATGISSKYGYAGTAAEWQTPDGEIIATGGAYQFNLRTSESTLNALGIMNSSDNIIF